MIDHNLIAEHYPRHPRGYFDHAAVSTVPVAVERAVAEVARALTSGTRGSELWHDLTDRAVEYLAVELGVASSALSVLANTSTAFNSIARAIPFERGDEVVVFGDDFPSPRMPWRTVPAVTVREITPQPGIDRTGALQSAIGKATRVISITHVHATTGSVVDLERLHATCLDADVLLVVDAAQAAGLFPGAAAHADVYVGASYKWLQAGFGAAVVATGDRFSDRAVPGLIGYMNEPPSPRLPVGHSNLFGLAALQAAASVRQQIGLDAIRNQYIEARADDRGRRSRPGARAVG